MATATNAATAGTDPNAPPDDAINPANVGKAPATPATPALPTPSAVAPPTTPDAVGPGQSQTISTGAPPVSPAVAPSAPASLPTASAVDTSPSNVTPTFIGAGSGGLRPSDPANVGTPLLPPGPPPLGVTPPTQGTPIPDFTGSNPTGMLGDAGSPVLPPASVVPSVGSGAATSGGAGSTITDPTQALQGVAPPAPLAGLPTSGVVAGTGSGAATTGGVSSQITDPSQALAGSAPLAIGGTGGAALAPATGGAPQGTSPTAPPTVTANQTLQGLLAGAPTGGAPTATPTDPNNPLTAQTLSVGALNDPLALAESQQQTFANSTEPQYQADLRDAIRSAAAGGAIGSGTLNTSLGDIANTRQNTLATNQQQELEQALGQQNTNAYANLNQADQQQGFQAGQEQQGFNNALGTTQEQSALNSNDFAQSLAQLTAGEANNPAQLETTVSQIFGNDAAAANQALAALTKAGATNSTTGASTQALQTAIQQYLKSVGSGGGTTTGTPTSTGTPSGNTSGGTQPAGTQSTGTSGIFPDGAGGYVDANGDPVDEYGNSLVG